MQPLAIERQGTNRRTLGDSGVAGGAGAAVGEAKADVRTGDVVVTVVADASAGTAGSAAAPSSGEGYIPGDDDHSDEVRGCVRVISAQCSRFKKYVLCRAAGSS